MLPGTQPRGRTVVSGWGTVGQTPVPWSESEVQAATLLVDLPLVKLSISVKKRLLPHLV